MNENADEHMFKILLFPCNVFIYISKRTFDLFLERDVRFILGFKWTFDLFWKETFDLFWDLNGRSNFIGF